MNELQSFKTLVKERGFYNSKSQGLILRGINRGPESCLKLDEDKRVWLEIEMDKDNDESYQLYLNLLDRNDPYEDEFDKLVQSEGLKTYKVFKDNKVNSGAKLFKFLRKKKILCPTDIEKVTTKRNTQQLWLCISQNPIDFMFCSTNQSFTSCLDLNSDYEGAFYMGLLGLSVDKNRFIAFSTKDKNGFLSEINGETYTQYKIVSRCWGLLGRNSTFVLERYYPFKTVGFAKNIEAHTGLEYNRSDGREFKDNWCSKYTVPVVKDIEGRSRWVYIDTIGINFWDKYSDVDLDDEFMYFYEGDTGSTGNCEYSYGLGLDNLKEFKFLTHGAKYCDGCGEIHYGRDMRYINSNTLCRECSKEYIVCECCHEYIKNDQFNTEIDGKKVCDRCVKEYYKKCNTCGKLVHRYDTHGDCLCRDCWNKMNKRCDRCGDRVDETEYDRNEGFCDLCRSNYSRTSKVSKSVDQMRLDGEIKPGMKFRLRDEFINYDDDPNTNRTMNEFLGTEVTCANAPNGGGSSYGRDFIRIKEDGESWLWDARWFMDYKVFKKKEARVKKEKTVIEGWGDSISLRDVEMQYTERILRSDSSSTWRAI